MSFLFRTSELEIDRNNEQLCFGQLYGMCDHVTFMLSFDGFHTFKSVPYGTVDDTLLYLVRRAHENKSVLERTIFERFLIRKEIKRRFGNLFFNS